MLHELRDPSAAPSLEPLRLEPARCCVCDRIDVDPLAVGEDFEYRTSPDTFLAVRCRGCGLVYLRHRPAPSELARIYPPSYHAFDFSPSRFGLAYAVRRRLEARRLLSFCRDLPPAARILDVGCGDGFHLKLLRDFGEPGWVLEGIDSSPRAVASASRAGITAREGTVEALAHGPERYDLALLIATIEHVHAPARGPRRPCGGCSGRAARWSW